jgi:hypothetical protein
MNKMTLHDLADHHAKQAEHFAPFGAGNALTVFHSEAADLCRSTANSVSISAHWRLHAYVLLGIMRDKMTPDDVDAVQRFLGPLEDCQL